jgi:predicted amidohydrolase
MKISLIQMKTEETPFANIKKVNALTAGIKNNIVLLPELFTTGFNYKHIDAVKEEHSSILNLLNDSNIFMGSIIRYTDDGKYNSFFIKNNDNISYVYDKIHLFPLMDEDKHFNCGNKTGVFELHNIKCGASICFDIRFPELYRTYFLDDVKIMFISAQWPLIRKEHLITLAKARAIENQCYVVLCNSVGTIWEEDFAGNSCIISPWGEFIISAEDKQDKIFSGEININFVDDARKRIPIKECIRFSVTKI